MRAKISGKVLSIDSYDSKRKNRKVYTMDLYDGREVIRVEDVPDQYRQSLDETLDSIDVRVYSTQRGLYVVYNGER